MHAALTQLIEMKVEETPVYLCLNPLLFFADKARNSWATGKFKGTGEICCWLTGWGHSTDHNLPHGGKIAPLWYYSVRRPCPLLFNQNVYSSNNSRDVFKPNIATGPGLGFSWLKSSFPLYLRLALLATQNAQISSFLVPNFLHCIHWIWKCLIKANLSSDQLLNGKMGDPIELLYPSWWLNKQLQANVSPIQQMALSRFIWIKDMRTAVLLWY